MLAEPWTDEPPALPWTRLLPASSRSGRRTPSWMEHAACREMDPELFFPDPDGSAMRLAQAKSACAACRVVSECRAHGERVEAGLARSEWYSVLGGETPAERLARRPA